ncbi:MAG: mannose-1-phosphate guanylyltransferase [Deltaproteobacteria bacterium]|nr:mannose-1-phosphate guanylyltransferase [Deltaproteobacteria bacterium]
MEKAQNEKVAVIMAGGMGTRFWPLSTAQRPKQFLKLFDDRSLLQKSFDRIADLFAPERILVLTNRAFVDLTREQLPEIPVENIIGEPLKRDTAAAVCLGALLCREIFGNPVMITLTADHMIEPQEVFHKTLLSAVNMAQQSSALYTLGIQPTHPSTGYGYLELGQKVADDGEIEHFKLIRFKEKPDPETARQYVASGRFLWNSGMFVWNTDNILDEMTRYLPHHVKAISEAVQAFDTSRWMEALEGAFASLERISIDYGVMEKAMEVRCVWCRFSWKDVGGWQALSDYLPQAEGGNYFRGHLEQLDSKGNLVFCEDPEETVMLVGVQDLIAVRSGGNTLITHKDRAEEVKKLVEKMQEKS